MLYEKLNERKKELGLTTEQLSQLSGVPVGTLNKILSGETRSPRYDTLREIERVLYGGESGTKYEADADCVKEEAAVYFTKKQGEYTLEDYRRLPDDVRAELIDGELIFLEAPSFTHQELITELLVEIKMFIRSQKGPCRVLPFPLDVQLDCDDRTMVQPDIALICRDERITKKRDLRSAGLLYRDRLRLQQKEGLRIEGPEIHECRCEGVLDRGSEEREDCMLLV